MLKIGLLGKVRSGKNTVADYAEGRYNMYQLAFGDELKKGFHQENPHIPRKPKPVRGYQLYGQLKRYTVSESIWIDSLFDKIAMLQELADGYSEGQVELNPIVTDVRQADEVARLKEEGFTLIRVSCPDEIRLQRMQAKGDNVDSKDLTFETETALDNYVADFEIINDGSLENLYKQFDEIILTLTNKDVE